MIYTFVLAGGMLGLILGGVDHLLGARKLLSLSAVAPFAILLAISVEGHIHTGEHLYNNNFGGLWLIGPLAMSVTNLFGYGIFELACSVWRELK